MVLERRQGAGAGTGGVLGPRHDASTRVQKPESIADKMAALKARVEAAIGSSKAKGGLNVSLHPALEDRGQWRAGSTGTSTGTGRATPSVPSSSSSALHGGGSSSHNKNQRTWPGHMGGAADHGRNGSNSNGSNKIISHSNPYVDETAGAGTGRPRQRRELIFNQKGKYIQQASALRRQAMLEDMKRRIAATTRAAGMDEDLDSRRFVVEAPPAVEWWDEGLVGSYDDVAAGTARIGTADSIVTEFVQHPVGLEPPQDRLAPAPKPMFLTKSEQRKARRQRRMRDHKEEQAKQRLGLEPAPPPKVKKGNLMRVLGDAVINDPTAVEMQVNREIEERRRRHLQANEDKRLGPDERREKLAANQAQDAAKGLHMLVFRIDSLANGQHRYKIGMNAEQQALTGVCVMHPRFNLVVVEGGQHSIRKYRRLLMERMDWRANAPERGRERDTNGAGVTSAAAAAESSAGPRSGPASVRDWLRAETELGELKDLSTNQCKLVFEGEQKARAFRKWSTKVCETESEAREVLSRAKLENLWSLAKGAS